MTVFKKIQIDAKHVAIFTLSLALNWAIAFAACLYSGIENGLSISIFLVLDVFFCPIVCAILSGLLVYDRIRYEKKQSWLTLAAMVFGFIPFVLWLIPFALMILQDVGL